jgi:hypothetical protein
MKKCFYYIVSLFMITWFVGCNDEQDYPKKNGEETTIGYDTLHNEPTDTISNEPTDSIGDESTDSVDTAFTDSTDTYQSPIGDGFNGDGYHEQTDSTSSVADSTGDDGDNDDRKGNGTDNNPHRRRPGIAGNSTKRTR